MFNNIFVQLLLLDHLRNFILVFLLISISSSYDVELNSLTPGTCSEEDNHRHDDEQCKYCDATDKCIECRKSQTTTISGYKHCQSKCYENQYGTYNHTSYEECRFCTKACNGCNGPSSLIDEESGCKRCKIGIHSNKTKKCLYSDNFDTTCVDNDYKNFYQDKANISEKLWTDFVCRQCHPSCTSCSSYGSDPINNNCTCEIFMKTDGSNSICTKSCPETFQILQHGNLHYSLCIQCEQGYELDSVNAKCIKEIKLWSFENAAYIISIIVLSISLAISALALMLWIKSLYKKMHKRRNVAEEIPLNYVGTFPEYNPGSLYEELAQQVRSQLRNPEDFLISELEIEVYQDEKNLLGFGEFGNVYKGKFHDEYVAVKVIKEKEAQMEAYKVEGKIMTVHLAGHLHLHTLKGICQGRQTLLVSDLRLGSLKNYLIKNETELQQWHLFLYCYQIANAMTFLEAHNIIHRDLAARNVLVKNSTHVEVSDFGLSRVDHKNNLDRDYGQKFAWRWLSIEALEYHTFTIENDIWAYGVTCWEIFNFGKFLPYDDIFVGSDRKISMDSVISNKPRNLTAPQLYKALIKGVRLTKPNSCDKGTFYTLSECWLQVPSSRPKFIKLETIFNAKVNELRPNLMLEPTRQDSSNSDTSNDSDKIEYESPKPSFSTRVMSLETQDSMVNNERVSPKLIHETSDAYQSASEYETDKEELLNKRPIPNIEINIAEEMIPYQIDTDLQTSISLVSTLSNKSSSSNDSGFSSSLETRTEDPLFNQQKEKLNAKTIQLKETHSKQKTKLMEILQEFSQLNKLVFDENASAFNFNMDDFEEIEVLSETKSSIKKYLHKPTNKEIAIKLFPITKNGKEKPSKIKNLINEINALKTMKYSSHIVQFYGLSASYEEKCVKICMELMDFSLEIMHKRFIENLGFIPEDLISKIIVCLVDTLQEFHTHNIVNHELHQSHILLNRKGEIKFCDFKVSKILEDSLQDRNKITKERAGSITRDMDSLANMLIELIYDSSELTIFDSIRRRKKIKPVNITEEDPQNSILINEFISACNSKHADYQRLKETKLYMDNCKISTPDDIGKNLNEYKFLFCNQMYLSI